VDAERALVWPSVREQSSTLAKEWGGNHTEAIPAFTVESERVGHQEPKKRNPFERSDEQV
jgi:hypothetical protein